MNKKDFENLVASVKQAGKIKRGEMKASRVFSPEADGYKDGQKKAQLFPIGVCIDDRREPADTSKLGTRTPTS